MLKRLLETWNSSKTSTTFRRWKGGVGVGTIGEATEFDQQGPSLEKKTGCFMWGDSKILMGIVWEAYHKGVPMSLGVPENPTDFRVDEWSVRTTTCLAGYSYKPSFPTTGKGDKPRDIGFRFLTRQNIWELHHPLSRCFLLIFPASDVPIPLPQIR